MNIWQLLKSRTIWGTVLMIIGYLSDPSVLAILPANVSIGVKAVGALLAAIGIRVAVANSTPDAQKPPA